MIYFSYFVKHEIKLFGFFLPHSHLSLIYHAFLGPFVFSYRKKSQNNVQIPIGPSILHYCDFADVIIIVIIA